MNRKRILLAVVALLALSGSAWALLARPPIAPADDPLLRRIEGAAVILDTVDPTRDFGDLMPLKAILADRRIVAMGEATHGTREFFQMKQRMFEFLVEELGFTLFGMECSTQISADVNAFLQGGAGDAADIANHLTYWPWATEEVRDLLLWMRDYNARPGLARQLRFYGLDPVGGNRDAQMATNAKAILMDNPDDKMMIWAHNYHVAMKVSERMGFHLKQAFGAQVYLIGFEFSEGDFTSRDFTHLRVYHVAPAAGDYYASDLARLEAPQFFLDFATMERTPELASWLAGPRKSHSLDEMYYLFGIYEPWQSEQTAWPDLFDGVVFVRSTTYSRPLPGGWLPFLEPTPCP